MQKILWCLLLGLGIHITVRAQEALVYTINAGEIVSAVIPLNEQYVYGEFQQGTVFFANASSLPALLNYNRLYWEMQFIDSKGDTLALVEENSLKKIAIGEELFYYVNKTGFVEVITAQFPVKLARKQNLEISRSSFKLVGPSRGVFAGGPGNNMNGTAGTGSTHTSGLSYRELYTQKAPGELQLAMQSSYYFVDQNERIYRAQRSTLLKLFGRHKKAIEDYIDTNLLDFTEEEDLKKLLAFCAQWTQK
jgi:hypothetical protein